MHRHAMSDEHWERLLRILPKRRRGPKSNERLFIDAVLYRAKTGVAWRDLPERFGSWKSVYNRFASWSRRRLWERIFQAIQTRVDVSVSIADGTVVRAHQDSCGGKGGSNPMRWAALEAVFPPSFTRLSMPGASRSMSR